jgi:UTP--glucose-1-phosphate uridylyltransferase
VDGLAESVEKMREAGASRPAVDAFTHYYRRLAGGESGLLPESEIEPVDDVPDAEELPDPGKAAAEALDRTVVIKLNGGLGTSMGMTGAKSLIEAKDGYSFLDLIALQVLEDRRRHRVRLPLVLMNSFRTRDDSLAALERYPELRSDVPLDFVQGKVPKLRADDLRPVSWPEDPSLEWTPPGHGDLYTSLVSSGMLEQLRARGYEHAFVSNSDNLGAVVEPRIAAWFEREQLPFVMEVADRTESDRKGGHISRRRGGGLVLRETAQTPDGDLDAFQDVERHRYFNANSLWVSLGSLERLMEERGNVLELPMIVNRKTVDPADSSSPEVIQLETAMGAAIDVFEGAAAIRVPRSRLVPVKTTDDLLAVRSDAYELTDDYRLRGRAPVIELDPGYFKLLGDFEQRFAHGPPSLSECERLTVQGDVLFGRDVTIRGAVTIDQGPGGPLRIPDRAVLGG